MQTQGRGRIICAAEKAFEFRSILNDILEEYKQLPPDTEITESERLRRFCLALTYTNALICDYLLVLQ